MKKITLPFLVILFSAIIANAQISESITINIGAVNLTDSVNKPHMLGVIAGPSPNYSSTAPDLTTRYQDVGITTVRNNDYFDDRLDMERMFFCGSYPINNFTPEYPKWNCDPNNIANYHFTESDAQFQNWINGGFLPFFRLGGENNHPIRTHDYKGPRSADEANWLKAGLKVVGRYNTFGGNQNTLAGYLNLWTEYPQKSFWDRDSLSFTNFWCANLDSLKSNFPGLKVGGPGFNSSISTALGTSTIGVVNTHINLLLRELKLRNLKPDWIGFHVFSNNIEDYYNTSIAFRKLLRSEAPFNSYTSVWGSGNASFFQGTELICDAWGFDNDQTLPASTRDSLFNKQRGAANHVGAFIAFQQTDIERAYLYRGGELGSDTLQGVMGLFKANGNYKPVTYGFKMCSKMQTLYNKKLTSPVYALASGGSKLWTLAGQGADGSKAILISNPSSKTINLTLTINNINLSTLLYPYINQYSITDTNNGQAPGGWVGGTFVLPPYTSHLITMSNSEVGINERKLNNNEIRIYPNPANDMISFSESLQNIKVYNVFGQLVLCEINQSKSISTQNLANGIYFIHSNQAVMKFIVEH